MIYRRRALSRGQTRARAFSHRTPELSNSAFCLFALRVDATPDPTLLFCGRKLKKLLRELKSKGAAETAQEEERPPQQWNLDYALAPFEGLTPEYMEMSEFLQAA